MANYKQADRLMRITTPLDKDTLLLESFWGVESISHLFEFHAELLAEVATDIDPKKLVGAKVTVTIDLSDVVGSRYFSGMIASFEQGGGDTEFYTYRARIVPSLWQLTLSTNCRVFQDMTVMDIVKNVIGVYKLSVQDKTTGTYKPLEYCTQYQESDYDFIARLLEQHGIFYYFEHTDSDNAIVFGDSRDVYTDCPLAAEVDYAPDGVGEEGAYGSLVSEFNLISTMVSGSHTYWDYDFRAAGAARTIDSVKSKSPYGNNAYEQYYYPAGEQGYAKKTDSRHTNQKYGDGFLQAETDAGDATAEIFHGLSDTRSFCSGYTFTMDKHPRSDWNRKYLLTEVVHHADQVPSYRSETAEGAGYSNQFKGITSDIVYRPQIVTPWPVIYGPQTALVVASAGEEMDVDKLGRVCLQMFWDRERKPNTEDNTWVRVAQPWAGQQWGAHFWPRAGHEVVVAFIDGDPDAPLVVGSVYNSQNTPPYGLPDNQTRSGILAHSTKGGGAPANEIRFEDKKGSEQVYLHAQKDMDQRVENDLRVYVAGKDSKIIMAGQYEDITGDRHTHMTGDLVDKIDGQAGINIGTNLNEKVGSNYSQQVGMNHAHTVGSNYSLDAGMEAYLKAGMTLVIESGMNLCLKGAGGFITIGPAGVAISGTMVLINSGGAAVPGTAGQTQDPASPTKPDTADDGSKGGKLS